MHSWKDCSNDNNEVLFMKTPDYEQVKKRVNRESVILPELVIKTGIGMVAAILIAVFLFR